MRVQELYDFITEQMTPEEALKKLLSSSIINYDKLKFDSKEESVHPELIIVMAACDLGWHIGVRNDEEKLKGLIIGTEKFLKNYTCDY